MNKKWGIWSLVFVLLIIPFAAAQSGPAGCTNPTVVDGYISFENGSTVGAGVSVSVSVSGPNDCNSFSDLTDANGYYAVAGLDINGNTVTISGTHLTFPFSNSGVASGSTIRINEVIPPKAPTLTTVPDRHNDTSIVFEWSPLIPDNSPIANEWELVGVSSDSNATSPKTASASGFASYTWKVRTCYPSSGDCSSYSSDSFEVSNAVPTTPSQSAEPDTHSTSVTLEWTSGSDSDTLPTDSLVDEFYFDDDASPLSSPLQSNLSLATGSNSITVSGLTMGQTYYWLVRTCDNTFASNNCSSSTDSFQIVNTAPTAPVQTDQADTHNSFVNLTWTSGTDSDIPADSLVDEFYFDDDSNPLSGPLISNLTIPNGTHTFNVSGLIMGTTYYWLVRTCDDTFESNNCTSSSDSFTISNTAPSVPLLTEIDKTNSATQTLSWTSGIDPEGDPVTDEFQLSNVSDFSTLIVNNTAASSPQTVSLPDFDILYWRVRSCDDQDECSAYNSSIFQKYTCAGTTGTCPAGGDDDDDDDSQGDSRAGGGTLSFTSDTGASKADLDVTVIGITQLPNTIVSTLSPGESSIRQVKIENTGNKFLTVDINIAGLPNNALISAGQLAMDPGDSHIIDVTLRSPEGQARGVYAGSLVVTSQDIRETIGLVLEVVSEAPAFDTELILLETDQTVETVSPNANFYLPIKQHVIKPEISLEDLIGVGATEVEIVYEVRDLEGIIVYTEEETVAVDGQKSFIKEIILPRDVGIGEYIISVTVNYQGTTSVSTQKFEIAPTDYQSLLKTIWPWILIGLAVLLIAAHLLYVRKKMKAKPRFEHAHHQGRNIYQK